eukprot:364252-Chlamydomonas_euryale.AAC.1
MPSSHAEMPLAALWRVVRRTSAHRHTPAQLSTPPYTPPVCGSDAYELQLLGPYMRLPRGNLLAGGGSMGGVLHTSLLEASSLRRTIVHPSQGMHKDHKRDATAPQPCHSRMRVVRSTAASRPHHSRVMAAPWPHHKTKPCSTAAFASCPSAAQRKICLLSFGAKINEKFASLALELKSGA